MKTLLLLLSSLVLFASPGLAQDAKSPEAPAEKPVAPNPQILIKTSMGEITLELFQDECPETVANFLDLSEGKKEFTDSKTRKLVKRPYYDGLIFHRVIPSFMAQGGCSLGTGMGGPGYQFKDEINAEALGLHKVLAMQNGQPNPALGIRSQQQFQQIIGQAAIKKLGIKSQEELTKRQTEVNAAVGRLALKAVFENMGYVYDTTRKSHPMQRGTIAMANSGPNTNGSQFFLNMVDNYYLNGKHTVFGRITAGLEVVDAMQKVKMGEGNKPIEPIVIESIRRIAPEKKAQAPAEAPADK